MDFPNCSRHRISVFQRTKGASQLMSLSYK
uniref:Uncharacterized protein n=1 Tax=Rhizophora mucronata TaxID=61149 RepID=A0A2P2NBR9_RHIMU